MIFISCDPDDFEEITVRQVSTDLTTFTEGSIILQWDSEEPLSLDFSGLVDFEHLGGKVYQGQIRRSIVRSDVLTSQECLRLQALETLRLIPELPHEWTFDCEYNEGSCNINIQDETEKIHSFLEDYLSDGYITHDSVE